MVMTAETEFEVIIIGGSYAGLSAAMALGRSMRKVLIIDGGQRCNRQTPHAHNFITQDGNNPGSIAEKARNEVLKYSTVSLLNDVAVAGNKVESGFRIATQSGKDFTANKLIFASGVKDLMPQIKGFAECWGISVVHCPYCHGYEIRNQKTAIMANGARAYHLASLVNNLTKHITILTTGEADFTPEEIAKFAKNNITVNEKIVSELVHEKGQLQKVIFDDGSLEEYSALYAAIPFEQSSNIPNTLGCELTDTGYIKVNGFQATTVDGIYACGDNAAMMRSIASSVYTGNLAGAMVNKELTDEQF
jgi:thioredoxin reductase